MKKESYRELSHMYISEAGLLKFGIFIVRGLVYIHPASPGNYYYYQNVTFIA
jgi:hypothetical protein